MLRFDREGGRKADRVAAGRVLIDGTRTGEIADEVLRDRRHLAGDGLVVPVVAINGQTGALEQPPEIITRGLAVDARHEAMLREAPGLLARAIEAAPLEERTDPGSAQGADPGRDAADVPEACRPAAAGAAGRAWKSEERVLAESALSRRLSEFTGVALFAAALLWLVALVSYTPSDPAWFFNSVSDGGAAELRRPRRRVHGRSRRSSCSATRRSCSRCCSATSAGTTSGAARSKRATRSSSAARCWSASVAALLALAFSAFEPSARHFRAGGVIGEAIAAGFRRVPQPHRRGDSAPDAARALRRSSRRSSRSAGVQRRRQARARPARPARALPRVARRAAPRARAPAGRSTSTSRRPGRENAPEIADEGRRRRRETEGRARARPRPTLDDDEDDADASRRRARRPKPPAIKRAGPMPVAAAAAARPTPSRRRRPSAARAATCCRR